MSTDSIYTRSERTVQKYTVYQAIESARRRLAEKKWFKGKVCTNAVSGRANSEKITLEELNEIADEIVNDTRYYDGV